MTLDKIKMCNLLPESWRMASGNLIFDTYFNKKVLPETIKLNVSGRYACMYSVYLFIHVSRSIHNVLTF